MELKREAPLGMSQDIAEGGLYNALIFLCIACVTGLEETVVGSNSVVEREVVLACEDHFQFVTMRDAELSIGCGAELELWAARNMVDGGRKGVGAVGFDGNLFAQSMNRLAERIVNEKGGFTACEYDQRSWILPNFSTDVVCRHEAARLVLRIAKRTLEIAARKTDEYCSTPCVVAFTLDGIEYFVDFIVLHARQSCRRWYRLQYCLPIPAPVPCSTGESVPSSNGQCSQLWG